MPAQHFPIHRALRSRRPSSWRSRWRTRRWAIDRDEIINPPAPFSRLALGDPDFAATGKTAGWVAPRQIPSGTDAFVARQSEECHNRGVAAAGDSTMTSKADVPT